jgi:hypothetical protein
MNVCEERVLIVNGFAQPTFYFEFATLTSKAEAIRKTSRPLSRSHGKLIND